MRNDLYSILASSAGISFRLSGKISCKAKKLIAAMPVKTRRLWTSYVTLVDRLCYPHPHAINCSSQNYYKMSKAVLPLLPQDTIFLYSDTIRKNIDREYHFYVANWNKHEWNIDYFALTTDGRNLTKYMAKLCKSYLETKCEMWMEFIRIFATVQFIFGLYPTCI
jgi:hypothetical protein